MKKYLFFPERKKSFFYDVYITRVTSEIRTPDSNVQNFKILIHAETNTTIISVALRRVDRQITQQQFLNVITIKEKK